MFIPTWGNDPIWLIFFRWVETTNQLKIQGPNGLPAKMTRFLAGLTVTLRSYQGVNLPTRVGLRLCQGWQQDSSKRVWLRGCSVMPWRHDISSWFFRMFEVLQWCFGFLWTWPIEKFNHDITGAGGLVERCWKKRWWKNLTFGSPVYPLAPVWLFDQIHADLNFRALHVYSICNLHVWVWIVFAVCWTADATETLWTKHSVALQIKTGIVTNGAVHVPDLAYKFVGCCFMVEACHGRWNTWEGEREAKESQEWGDLRIY